MKDAANLMRAVASAHKYSKSKNKKACLDDFKEGLCPGFEFALKGSELLGVGPVQKALVRQWLQFKENVMSPGPSQDPSTFQIINTSLQDRTFLTGENISVADFVIYHSIEAQIKDMTFQERESVVHLVRWLVNIQTLLSSSPTSNLPVLLSRTMLY
eukprot:TRINITY_DN1233_c0_g1_i3.p1 TRINITY_DN1233_c0_g1~~TRINITY_DN1233_c0_g1_i3.p1  ORF type:complete len:157 (+),score=17.36 TRINITY_DN1233_c0_g1_i3:62-532(+)